MEGFPNSHTEVQISQARFQLFHTIDRVLYVILVADLLCDPTEAMQIMAIWLWLERVGFRNIIKRILYLPIILINELVDEANICLSFINNPQSIHISESSDIHLTQSLIQNFSIRYLQVNQIFAKFGVEKVRTEICMLAFSDLTHQVISQNETRRISQSQQQLLVQQGMFFNDSDHRVVPAEQRTMFVTFSKGYPVEEWEIRDFFIKKFGECIESFCMEDVKEVGDQPIYARIVLLQADIIHIILSGSSKAKFTINGKHVWMRKYVPRDQ